jgi:hypothetical protein
MIAHARMALALLAALPGASVVMAQTEPAAPTAAAPSFAAWHGAWTGTGSLFGGPSTAKARFAPALDGNALQFDFDLSFGGDRPQKFHGHGVYRVDAKGRITGQWMDVSGGLHQMKGQWSAREWTVTWGSPLTEVGRSRYRLTDDGGLAVTDWTLQNDGSWRIFAEMNYRRAAN